MSAEASDKTPVQLFVYDMSKGMAKSLSLMFLGEFRELLPHNMCD